MHSLYLKEAQGTGDVFPCLPAWFLACSWWLPAQPRVCDANTVGKPDAQEGFFPYAFPHPYRGRPHQGFLGCEVWWTINLKMPWVGRKCFQGLKILQRFWSGNGSCGLPKQIFVLLALLWAGSALWVQGYVWDLAEMGRQPSRAGSARGALFQADVVLAWGSAGLRQDVLILQRAESIEISNRLGMSEFSYEFLGKRIWQWQDVLWTGFALCIGGHTLLSRGLCWEPG